VWEDLVKMQQEEIHQWGLMSRGLPSCIRTAPIPFPEASHSIINVFVKSGVVKTGALHITSLSCSKDLVAYGVHENASFLVSVVKGVAILP
jgi:hypothetical protein